MQYLEDHDWAIPLLGFLGLCLAALFANFVVKVILLKILDQVIVRTPFGRNEAIRDNRVIHRLANVMPALVMSVGVSAIPDLPEAIVSIVKNVSNSFTVLVIALSISAFLNVVDRIYHGRADARLRPIKSYLQVMKIAMFVIAGILMVATIIDRSPVILLSGLGAMAAVLILVFQDTLLSLVASIQISATDMVRVGDWIEMPHMNADGDVIEIALHTVKVRNFDKTITTIPIRKMVTDNFKNWRGMQESGGRRIKRSLFLDQNSIGFLSVDQVASLQKIGVIEDYLGEKLKDVRNCRPHRTGRQQGSDAQKLNADPNSIGRISQRLKIAAGCMPVLSSAVFISFRKLLKNGTSSSICSWVVS